MEPVPQQGGETGELGGAEEGGRAAAEVELHDGTLAIDAGGVEGDLALDVIEVAVDQALAAGDDGVAAAIPAVRLAERQVDVEGDRAGAGGVVGGERGVDVERGEVGGEAVGRRVGRVARARDRMPADQAEVEGDGGGSGGGVVRQNHGDNITPGRRRGCARVGKICAAVVKGISGGQ